MDLAILPWRRFFPSTIVSLMRVCCLYRWHGLCGKCRARGRVSPPDAFFWQARFSYPVPPCSTNFREDLKSFKTSVAQDCGTCSFFRTRPG